ncbi:MTF1 factor, partial [Polypterus senegalus]
MALSWPVAGNYSTGKPSWLLPSAGPKTPRELRQRRLRPFTCQGGHYGRLAALKPSFYPVGRPTIPFGDLPLNVGLALSLRLSMERREPLCCLHSRYLPFTGSRRHLHRPAPMHSTIQLHRHERRIPRHSYHRRYPALKTGRVLVSRTAPESHATRMPRAVCSSPRPFSHRAPVSCRVHSALTALLILCGARSHCVPLSLRREGLTCTPASTISGASSRCTKSFSAFTGAAAVAPSSSTRSFSSSTPCKKRCRGSRYFSRPCKSKQLVITAGCIFASALSLPSGREPMSTSPSGTCSAVAHRLLGVGVFRGTAGHYKPAAICLLLYRGRLVSHNPSLLPAAFSSGAARLPLPPRRLGPVRGDAGLVGGLRVSSTVPTSTAGDQSVMRRLRLSLAALRHGLSFGSGHFAKQQDANQSLCLSDLSLLSTDSELRESSGNFPSLQKDISESSQQVTPSTTVSSTTPVTKCSQKALFESGPGMLQTPEVPVPLSTQPYSSSQDINVEGSPTRPTTKSHPVETEAIASTATSSVESLPTMVQTVPLAVNSVLTSNPTIAITPAQNTTILQPSIVMDDQNLQWILNKATNAQKSSEQSQQSTKVEKVFFTTAIPDGGSSGNHVQQIGLSVPVIIIKQEESCQCQCACRDSVKDKSSNKKDSPPPAAPTPPPLPPQSSSPPSHPSSSPPEKDKSHTKADFCIPGTSFYTPTSDIPLNFRGTQ